MNSVIAVIGAGTMGTGVAHNLAQYGFDTILIDNSQQQLDKSAELIRRNLRLYQFHEQHKPGKAVADEVMDCITLTTSLDAAVEASIVIENVTENWDIKAAVYQRLNDICGHDTVFGVNTSAISITKVAGLMNHPENVAGVHLMNPVPLKPTVELIRGVHTSDKTLQAFTTLFADMNKKTITVNDSPGFVTNRAMMIFVNEAIFMLHEGIAEVDDIDTLFRECFGHKMGPLQTADLIGLDTILQSLGMLYEGFNDDKFRPCFYLKKMVDAGYLGMKSGRGFYQYDINITD